VQDFDKVFFKLAFNNKIPSKQQLKNLILQASDFFTFLDFKRPSDYMTNQDFLKGYLIYFVPVSLAKIYSIMKEFFWHPSIFHKKHLKIIDIGCGPSPSVVSFFKLWQNRIISSDNIQYIGVELEEKAIELGEKIIQALKPQDLSIEYRFLKTDASDLKTYIKLKELNPDIMIFSNSIGEILDDKGIIDEDFINFIKYFSFNNEKFTLVLIEPGTKKSASRLQMLRDKLIKELNFYSYSPCLNNLPCPALQAKNWCYEERKWSAPSYLSFLSAKGLQVNYLKFSYIILTKDGINIKDTFEADEIVIKNTSHLLNEKGKSKLWGCWDGKLVHIERLKRDYIEHDPWLKIKKGTYFSIDRLETLSNNKIRIPANAKITILYSPYEDL